MRSINTYKSILKHKGIYVCFRELLKYTSPVWFTRDLYVISHIQANFTSRILYRKFKDIILRPLEEMPAGVPSKNIWIFWMQGIDNAPDIVKSCMNSVRHFAPDYEIHIVTQDNIKQYVSLPDHIYKALEEKRMSYAHFSDILRMALLYSYGGIWMDSTVLLTGTLPDYCTQEPLFFFQRQKYESLPHFGSNWFISSVKGNPIIKRMYELLLEYWKRESYVCDYFIFHIFMFLLINRNKSVKPYVDNIPYIVNLVPMVLLESLFDPFTQKKWDYALKYSSIHKLSYKHIPAGIEGTIYQHILNLKN